MINNKYIFMKLLSSVEILDKKNLTSIVEHKDCIILIDTSLPADSEGISLAIFTSNKEYRTWFKENSSYLLDEHILVKMKLNDGPILKETKWHFTNNIHSIKSESELNEKQKKWEEDNI